MRRRALLGGTAAALATIAGCSGIQSRLSGGGGGQQQQQQIQELQSEIEQKDQRISELETRVEELETNNERFKQAAEAQEKRRILARYADALKIRDKAQEEWNQAISHYQNQEFGAADFSFARTSGFWMSAALEFSHAAETANNQDQPNVQQLCISGQNHCTLMGNAATRFSRGARYYAEGQVDQGNTAVQEAQSTQQDANNHNVAPLSEVSSGLGLG